MEAVGRANEERLYRDFQDYTLLIPKIIAKVGEEKAVLLAFRDHIARARMEHYLEYNERAKNMPKEPDPEKYHIFLDDDGDDDDDEEDDAVQVENLVEDVVVPGGM